MRISIVGGSGYVGVVTGTGLSELGHYVTCIDVDKDKIENLKKSIPPIDEDGLEELINKNLKLNRLKFTTDLEFGMENADIVFITVGTPENEDGSADISCVLKAAEDIAKHIKEYTVIAVKSTVPVGTCDRVYDAILYNIKDKNIYFDVISNPEFLREGTSVKDFFNPDRIVIGSQSCIATGVIKELYKSFDCQVIVTSRRSAELIKYASNTFLAARLSFINEIAEICEKVGGDIEDVALGMGLDKRIGKSYLKAGIGFGGPCLVKDLKALIYTAEEMGCNNNFLKAALQRNYHQSENFIKKLKSIYGHLDRKNILLAGLSFKPGTDDIRNAPSLNLISMLYSQNALVTVYDPKVKKLPEPYNSMVCYANDMESGIKGKDALIFVTEWEEFYKINFNRASILMRNPVIIDGRNMFNKDDIKNGIKYISIGRSECDEEYVEKNAV